MVLDPFTALGLAGNLVQFVDFLYKLLSESKSLYASSSGVSAENVILETVAKDLSLLSAKLATPPSGGLVQRRSSQAGEELRILASLCQDVTKQLLGALEELKIKSPDKRWKSFLQALKTVWRKEKIEELAKRVDRAQRQLNTRLLAMMR
jgi:hypothetical protein